MGRFLYLRDGMANKNPATLELASRLRAAGHEVAFASHRDISKAVESEGFSFHHLNSDRALADKAQAAPAPTLSNVAALWRWLRLRRSLRAQSLRHTEVEDLIARIKPDLLLIDVECHYFIIAASETSVPIALPMLWFSIFRHSGLPPLNSKLQPGNGWRAQFTISLSWLRVRAGALRDRLATTYGRHALADLLRPVPYNAKGVRNLKSLARAKGFDWRAKTSRSHWLRPFVYPHLPTLCLNARESEFPHIPSASVHYVGPMIRAAKTGCNDRGSSDPQWRRFQSHRAQKNNSSRPLIYCSLGSFWNLDVDFLQKVIHVFRKRTDWDLALGLGGAGREMCIDEAPDNVFVFDWAPQRELLQHADCTISHGGVSSINECLASAVPMLIYSAKKVDQNGNAARIAYHELGLCADKDTDSAEDIEANIETCLASAEFKENLAQMKDTLEKYKAENVAIRILENLAQRKPSARPI
ncbi:MAG: glycosyltransferase [Pseudomonadota bacterium]